MEKQKKWQLFLILTVIALTVYNILPTLFYYSKPLKSPISETRAEEIAKSIESRVADLEPEAIAWVHSFCNMIQVKPQAVSADGQNISVRFTKSDEASRFRKLFPKAGSLIPFAPSQMRLVSQENDLKEVLIRRRVPSQIASQSIAYAKKDSPLYKNWIIDRAAQIGYALAGPSEQALQLESGDQRYLEALALQINSIKELSQTQKAVANRLAASFTKGHFANRSAAIKALVNGFDSIRDELKKHPELEKNAITFSTAENYLKKHERLFASGSDPWTLAEIKAQLSSANVLDIGKRNPLFSQLEIDWEKGEIKLLLHPDANPALLEQPLINEAAKVARLSNESIKAQNDTYIIDLNTLANTSGYLLIDLENIGKDQVTGILEKLQTNWTPQHPDLQNLTITTADSYESLPSDAKALSLVVHAPTEEDPALYVTAKGLEHIHKNYEQFPESELAQSFNRDFRSLIEVLQQNGFEPYRGKNQEIFFLNNDTYQSLLGATRETFQVKGTRKYAALELSNLEHRLLAENRIDTQIHEDLIKARDEHNAAQVSLEPSSRFDVPKPTKNIFLSNVVLSLKKMVRGDERKIIRWGLDLSGGKTVQIELRDANNRLVKNEEDIKQGINELYNRVNKMGVSEVAIRQLGNNIVLDFPGSQSMSASELIKASSMYFHVVNEKFSSPASPLAAATDRFLQEVWNEAVVTNQKDARQVSQIAYKHLHGERISEAAQTLLESGLVLQSPKESSSSNVLDDTVSKVACLRADHGQTHPLLIVFNNYTLEGSQLGSVHGNYDPQKGNYLTFDVKSFSFDRNGEKTNPRNDLYNWTSKYSKEKISGTSLEDYTKGRGWRMAVILNDSVISSPSLEAVIRDSGSISGHFSQREVNQLVSDLKAGALSFTPHILSEKNVSPELGQKERTQGIFATIVALVLVIISMIAYYRFAGLVASIAVIFNLLMLWATLQNIGATLSLAGIAGIILTVGMAVDANVLVFERVKEEFALTGNMKSAIAAGYKKAYSAIVDSNVTTIIAALILLNFDAGPIKGFAITLIIGIVSSMFSALFMTRYYFDGWVQKSKGKVLTMANWINAKSIDFLKHTKVAFALSLAIIAIGCSLVYTQRATIFGMDFTGGFSLHLEVANSTEAPRQSVENALTKAGASAQDFQIRELNPANNLRILFGTSMEQAGKPFYNMPLATEQKTNPRIDWVLDTLSKEGIYLTASSLANIESNWTAMSGQMSDSMRNNALLGLLVAFICIFIYITFRFEYKFAASSIICVIHDVFITLAVLGILHRLGVPVQIDLNTVAAIMTIVGYSLNDTIIIFDRIREETRISRNKSLPVIVNSALNATLSRTTITSGTTLLVLIALVALGGASIFSFALVMTIGVFLGTLSSWYIASPIMLMFQRREERPVVERVSS